jgi:hypothetical protein
MRVDLQPRIPGRPRIKLENFQKIFSGISGEDRQTVVSVSIHDHVRREPQASPLVRPSGSSHSGVARSRQRMGGAPRGDPGPAWDQPGKTLSSRNTFGNVSLHDGVSATSNGETLQGPNSLGKFPENIFGK